MLNRHHIHTLGFLPGITSASVQSLIKTGLNFEEITRLSADDLVVLGLKRRGIEALSNPGPFISIADNQAAIAEKFGGQIIHINDTRYPPLLRQIYSAPITLYVKGTLVSDDTRSLAIVGTRSASTYGKIMTEKYSAAFVRAGITVISGLARGIDTYAHNAALEHNGRTIAIVASGLDCIQPYYAAKLADKIAESGAVISEYPFGTKALPAYFPQRNRIICGMTTGTVVVESDVKGGAMITANQALDNNREVFAVPGPLNSSKSNGTNNLIRTDRARLTQSPEDVLDTLGYHIRQVSAERFAVYEPSLSMFEQRIYDKITNEPEHIDVLCERTSMNPNDVLINLLSLEFKGLVRQMAGKMFLRS